MKKKRILIYVIMMLIVCALGVAGYLYLTTPKIIFTSEPAILEIKESTDPMSLIKEVEHGDRNNITIKENTIDTNQLGEYQIIYQLDQHTFPLTVQVKDTKAPIVSTKELTIQVGETISAEDAIKEIKDATKTRVSWKETNAFDSIGDQNVILQVIDEGNNKTETGVLVHVLEKDTTPPVISAKDIVLQLHEEWDASKLATASDERDGDVDVKVERNDVDIHTPGTYHISFSATDKHGNKAEKTISVTIKQPKPIGDKIIYLTIDDGPSANTPAILDILDRYHVKATFFVTAQCPGYLDYITLAHQKGHAIGLHTYSHHYATIYANETAYFNDLQAISDVVYQQIGIHPNILRFPGGSSNTVSANYNSGIMSRLSKQVLAKGYQYFDWNGASGDGNSSLSASALIKEATSFGGQSPLMMLTHDHSGSGASVEALPAIIEYYQNLGYTFQTVDINTSGFHHGINN